MTFKTAIDFHVQFTLKMMSYCKTPDGSLDPDQVVKADICALGKWIETERQGTLSRDEIAELEAAHIVFHKAAAAVVRKVNAGFDGKSDVAFGSSSAYGKASVALTEILDRLGKKA